MELNQLMLFRETVAVYCEKHAENTNTLCGQIVDILFVIACGTLATTGLGVYYMT
jgi:hypothetical protein